MNYGPNFGCVRRVTLALACALVFSFSATTAQALPSQIEGVSLPTIIDDSIPDEALLLSTEYAQLPSGEVVNVSDGSPIENGELLGTPDEPPDPLDLTGGERFVPTSVGDTRDQMAESGLELLSTTIGDGGYGAYWGTYQGEPAFFMSNGTRVVCQAKGIVDVSEHNGVIDWAAARANGVEGVIIRIGFGTSRLDYQAQRNISECKRLGIPFGIYIYSYAYDADFAREEGRQVVAWMRELGVSPDDLALPVYFDLEQWHWSGHTPPTSPVVYTEIVRAWFEEVQGSGFQNANVYSYTSYLNGPLNSDFIHERTNWVAQYGSRLEFTDFGSNFRGWQYSSSGKIAGFPDGVSVDLNAFGFANWVNGGEGWLGDHDGFDFDGVAARVTDFPEGDYYLLSAESGFMSNVNNVITASGASGSQLFVSGMSGAQNQVFHIAPGDDGSYVITSIETGLALDASGPSWSNGTSIIQWPTNGGSNQGWMLYRDPSGWYYLASSYAGKRNKVIEIETSDVTNLGQIRLWAADGGDSQRFRLVSVSDYQPGLDGWVEQGGIRYFYDKGVRAEGKCIYDQAVGEWFWIDPDGTTAANKDAFIPLQDGGKWVRLDENGYMVKGEDARYGGWYYFDLITGAMAHGDVYLHSNGGKWVRYDFVTGQMIKGIHYYDGSWYYFDPITGAMAHGSTWVPDWNSWHLFDEITGRG